MVSFFTDLSGLSAMTGGAKVISGKTEFLIHAPDSYRVEMVLFAHYQDMDGKSYEMIRGKDHDFSLILPDDLTVRYYGYRLYNLDD